MSFPSSRHLRFIVLAIGLSSTSRAEPAADRLLRLVPADAGVTLAVENLRVHAREFFDSPLSEQVVQLPCAQRWFASESYRQLDQARRHFERRLGESSATLRDRLFGEALVLTLLAPPSGRPEDARGLLLLHVSDRRLLDRLIQSVNEAQTRKGELSKVLERRYKNVTYFTRQYAGAPARPSDYYVTSDDGTFAWANSEELLHGVIDRQEKNQGGLSEVEGFQQVRTRLPKSAVLSLFINPRSLEQALSSTPKPTTSQDEKIATFVGRYLSAHTYLGAALEWRDGVILHTQEELIPEKVGPWFQKWSQGSGKTSRLTGVPTNTLAFASIQLDFAAIEEALRDLITDAHRAQYENASLVLKGILLGHDLREVLPKIGPRVSASVIATESSESGISTVVSVDLNGEGTVAEMLGNGLRTLLALYALDSKHEKGQLRLETRQGGDLPVTSLVPTTPFAFSLTPDRLLVAETSAAILAEAKGNREVNNEFLSVRSTYFPNAESFLWFDLKAIQRFGEQHRESLIQKITTQDRKTRSKATSDLDRALQFLGLFRTLFFTSELSSAGHSLHRTLGLIGRDLTAMPKPAVSAPDEATRKTEP